MKFSHHTKRHETIRTGRYKSDTLTDWKPVFKNIVTLDPHRCQQAWSKLGIFTPAVEFSELPIRMHKAMVHAIQESIALNGMKAPQGLDTDVSQSTVERLRQAGT